MKIKESLNVTFNETHPPSKPSPLVDDDLDKEETIKVTEKKNLENDIEDETLEVDEIGNTKESMNHPLDNVIGNLNQRTLRSHSKGGEVSKKVNSGYVVDNFLKGCGEAYVGNEGDKRLEEGFEDKKYEGDDVLR
ncbi:hypothetical protein Tco_1353357 [Tanacetum coccineum]